MKRKKKSALAKKQDNRSSKYWRDKADAEWSRIVRQLGKCLVGIDCSGPLNAHHLIGRSNLTTRHDPANGACLCSKHHRFDSRLSAHNAPAAFCAWLESRYPELWQYVKDHRNDLQTDKPDYQARYETLKGQ